MGRYTLEQEADKEFVFLMSRAHDRADVLECYAQCAPSPPPLAP